MDNFDDLYTDYLISSSSYTTATGMASLLSIKHDKITRALSTGVYDSKFLWKKAKPYIEELTQSKERWIQLINATIPLLFIALQILHLVLDIYTFFWVYYLIFLELF